MENKKNRLDIRLDPETTELLNSLLARTNLTKTSLIKKALVVYTSTLNKGHIFTIRYKAQNKSVQEKPQIDEQDKRSFDEIIEDLDK